MMTKLKLFAAGGGIVILLLFGTAYYLRGIALDRCEAKIEQIQQLTELLDGQIREAARQAQRAAEDAERRRLRSLREIRQHDPNTAPSPAVRDAMRLLCSQGAACGHVAGANGS